MKKQTKHLIAFSLILGLAASVVQGPVVVRAESEVKSQKEISTFSIPADEVTVIPSVVPSILPSVTTTAVPSIKPTVAPTSSPSAKPSVAPSAVPSIKPSQQPVKKPKIAVAKKIVNVGQTLTLKVVDGSGTTVWKSSNEKTATVNKGVVKAKRAGTVKITAINKGYTMTCTITVTNMKLSKSKTYVTVGKTQTLTLSGRGTHKVTWKTSNRSVVTVSQKGVITGKKKGTATITASCRTLSFACKVVVLPNQRTLNTYDFKIKDLPKNSGYIVLRNITYSGRDLKIAADAYNNYSQKLASASSITITLYQRGKMIGKQTYYNRTLNINARSQKKMTFVMKDKYVKKKNMDLRTSGITADISIGMCSFA